MAACGLTVDTPGMPVGGTPPTTVLGMVAVARMGAGHSDRTGERRDNVAWHGGLVSRGDIDASGRSGIAHSDHAFIDHDVGEPPAIAEGRPGLALDVRRVPSGSAHRGDRIGSMYFEVGHASGGIDHRAQHSPEQAYLCRGSAARGRQRMIIDYQIARFAELELAAIGQCDDGMTTGAGDYSIAHVDRGSWACRQRDRWRAAPGRCLTRSRWCLPPAFARSLATRLPRGSRTPTRAETSVSLVASRALHIARMGHPWATSVAVYEGERKSNRKRCLLQASMPKTNSQIVDFGCSSSRIADLSDDRQAPQKTARTIINDGAGRKKTSDARN